MALGVALHIGDVLYGNVGSPSRLDFTVIGPAVNTTARMEQLCKELDVALVISADMARLIETTPLRSLGQHALRGLAGTRELFTAD